MRSFLTALALGCALLAAPAADAQTAGVPLQVRTGEVYTVSVVQTQSTEVGEQNLEASLSHVYALHIVDAENRVWRYMPASMSYSLPTGFGIEEAAANLNWEVLSEAMSAMLRLATDVGIECRVNEYGRCVEMSNWPLWRDRTENLVLMADAFARMAPQTTPTAEIEPSTASDVPKGEASPAVTPAPNWAILREPVLRGLASMLDNVDARDAAATMASIEMASSIQGRTLTRRQTVPVTDELDMPFGAPPLRFNGTMRLERIDQRNNTATIVRRVALDEGSARASLEGVNSFIATNFIRPVAEATGEQDAEAMIGTLNGLLSAVSFGYEETTTGIVDLTTGMARETTTDYTLSLTPPSGAGGGEPLSLRGRTTIRITVGAPPVQRLPRGQ